MGRVIHENAATSPTYLSLKVRVTCEGRGHVNGSITIRPDPLMRD